MPGMEDWMGNGTVWDSYGGLITNSRHQILLTVIQTMIVVSGKLKKLQVKEFESIFVFPLGSLLRL